MSGNSLIKYDPPVVQRGKAAPVQKKGGSNTVEDLLDAIVPPRTFTTDEGALWLQRISATPATKTDVVHLQETLDQKLQQKQARETGICPIREALYSEAFDEIIRQVVISAAERGVLLLRVRDEIRMVLAAYQTLYESSVAFGMRSALMAEQRRSELQAKIKLLSAEVAELEQTVETLTAKCEEVEASEKQRSAAEEEKHAGEVAKLQQANQTLREELESLLAPPRR